MIYTEKTKKALALCFEAHKNQVDKAGMPYVFHPFHLAEQMKTEEETIVALLHDVVEDTDYTLADLEKMGFGVSVIEALKLLTHDTSVDYFDYVKAISQNEIARAVKIADLTHNSTLERFDYKDITPWDIERQKKYFKALEILGEVPYKNKYMLCICCGATTFNKDYVGAFDTCPICGFNDEDLVTKDITLEGARQHFIESKKIIKYVLPLGLRREKMTNLKYERKPSKNEITITGLSDKNVTEVVIPDEIDGSKVTEIGDSAFWDCEELTSVIIPKGVTTIGVSAFSGCNELRSIIIPDSVTTIGAFAFFNCTRLKNIEFPNSIATIGRSAFMYCKGLTSVTIPNSVSKIETNIFSGCTGLTSVVIPNSVTAIGSSAFHGCTGLKIIVIPKGVTAIGSSAFWGCTSLTNITIPNSVTKIGLSAFFNCTSLTNITIPNSVTKMDSHVFLKCDNLTIYAQANSKPRGWDSNWNPDNRPVVWGHNGQ